MLDNFEQALQEYEYHLRNPYDDWYDEIPDYEYEDPEVDRRLEDRDE